MNIFFIFLNKASILDKNKDLIAIKDFCTVDHWTYSVQEIQQGGGTDWQWSPAIQNGKKNQIKMHLNNQQNYNS